MSDAQLKAAKEQLRQAEKAVETQRTVIRQVETERSVLQSSIRQREAILEAARLNYGYTKIYDHIRGSLSSGIDESTWTITSYLVSNAIIIPMTGWLSRVFGRKRYLIFSITLFTISSFLCGSAWSLKSLVFFRILQGIGGGALQPISQSILLETFPPRQHGMAMAIFGVGIMFQSGFIVTLSIISVISLILFIIVEMFAEHPIVNLKAFKSISFSTCAIRNALICYNHPYERYKT